MKRRNRLIVLIAVPGAVAAATIAVAGCFQSFDPNSASGVARNGGGDGAVGACPAGEVCDNPGATQCTLDSPECFYLCGSPLCALGNNPAAPDAGAVIPQASADPPIYLGSTDNQIEADGSTTTDPCVQLESQSLFIRRQSCAGCHSSPAGTTKAACGCALTDILSDETLVTSQSPDFTTDGGVPARYVVPGDPAHSLLYQRIAAGQMPPSASLAFQILGPEAGAALAYPTPADLSVLYSWILDCVGDAGGGAYATSTYGGAIGGTACFGPCGEGGAADSGD